jgi:beta-glucosidase
MSLEEKLAQLGCVRIEALLSDGRFDPERASHIIPHGIGQITRIGGSTELLPGQSARLVAVIQRWLVEATRLSVPAVVHEEASGGYCARGATVFPQAIGQAST